MTSKEKRLFIIGLGFVLASVFIFKVVENYSFYFAVLRGSLSMLQPFLIALIIAYLFNPIVNLFEFKGKINRGISILLSYIVVILVLAITIGFVLPVIIDSVSEIVNLMPQYIAEMEKFITDFDFNKLFNDSEFTGMIKTNVLNALPTLGKLVTVSVTGIVNYTLSAVMVTLNTLIALIISIYILIEKDKLIEYTRKLIKIIFKTKAEKVFEVTTFLHSNLGKYILGKGLDSIILGVLAIVALTVLQTKYALLLGILFGISNMIPYIGPIGSTIIIGLVNLFSNPTNAILSIIILTLIQQLESFYLEPKLVGKQIGVSPLLSLFAIFIFGNLFGMIGMIIAVPIMGIIKYYGIRYINRKYTQVVVTEVIDEV